MEIKTKECLVQKLSELNPGDIFCLDGKYFVMTDECGSVGKERVFDLQLNHADELDGNIEGFVMKGTLILTGKTTGNRIDCLC